MPSGEFLGGVLLAGVLAAAGVAKLADLEGSRNALTAFGVPRSLAAPLGTLLPIAELATAGLLVAGVGGDAGGVLAAGALSALFLLALFCAGIALSLVRGRAPDCHCFGQLHSAPASIGTLARNGLLLTLAMFVASGGDVAWTVAAGAVALVMLGLVAALSSRNGRAEAGKLAAEGGFRLGIPAPAFELPSLNGDPVSLAALRERGKPVLLVFSDPQCGPCLALAPDVASWQRHHADELTIAVIESRDGAPARAADEHGRENVLLQRESEVAEAYRASGTPTAVLVGAEGEVASPVAGGATEIEALVAENVTGLRPVPPNAVSRRPAPGRLGGRLIRRELLLRAAGASAATSAVLAWPLRAVAGVTATRDRRCRRDADCGPKQKCVGQEQNARCKCTGDRFPDECGRDCTDFKIDDKNCGGCHTGSHEECLPGQTTCVDGDCVGGDTAGSSCHGNNEGPRCPAGSVCCAEPTEFENVRELICRDLKHDVKACGGCNKPPCEGKTPACCGGKCADTHGDPRNCGECGKRCKQDEGCHQGKCVKNCPPGLKKCSTGQLRTCYQESSEICCGGRVTSREGYTNPKCCGDEIVDHEESAWFCP